MSSAPQWIVLAQILRPQGRKGEVLADLFTDFPERFDLHPRVWLAPVGFAESAPALSPASTSPAQPFGIVAHWLPVGRNAGRIVLHFSGIDTIEAAERLAEKEVVVPIHERLPVEEGAAYISDLVGSTVYDRDLPLGVVESVEFPMSSDGARRLEEAAPLLAVVSPEGDEILIPFANAFLISMDAATKSIRMALPEGLVEINRSPAKADEGPVVNDD